jgi:hypothetical protein
MLPHSPAGEMAVETDKATVLVPVRVMAVVIVPPIFQASPKTKKLKF